MPLLLLIALFLAFGFDPPARPGQAVLAWGEIEARTAEAAVGVFAVGAFAFLLGKFVAWRINRDGRATSRVRRIYVFGVRIVNALNIVVFTWIIHRLAWPRVVRSALGMSDPVLIDDVLILLPFLMTQLLGWWGIFRVEAALRPSLAALGVRRSLALKARQSWGMVLPLAGVYALASDLVRLYWPSLASSAWEQPLSLAALGVLVLVVAPLFVRIAWPTRPLPAGPLRDRLEHLAGRVGFRCTDILVWDTNQLVLNAAVTGSLPWFRYVLLSDALIENLGPHEVSAVFGHEIGHIAHRHLASFGLFIVGSIGVLFLGEGAFDPSPYLPLWAVGEGTPALLARLSASLLLIGGYFLLVFGFVSRRFERQADVFGCRAVSCGRPDCPPHTDLDDEFALRSAPDLAGLPLCPVGVRIFINALSSVAVLNGMRPSAWSWRHGSIQRRTTFLEGLIGRPEAERRFQTGVRRMRRVVAFVLALSALALASASGYWK